MPGTKPPPSIRAFFQVYVSAASETFAGLSAASAGGVPASSPAASASTAVRMRVLRTGESFPERGERGGGGRAGSPAGSAGTAGGRGVLGTGESFPGGGGRGGVSAFRTARESPGDPQCGRGPPGRSAPPSGGGASYVEPSSGSAPET